MITGPYNSVRGMADGDPVKVDNEHRTAGRREAGSDRSVAGHRHQPDRHV